MDIGYSLKIKITNKSIIIAFCSFALFPSFVNSQSLEQAVALTLDIHPELKVAFSNFKRNEEQIKQAQAGYFPTIDLIGGIGYEYTDSPSTRDVNDNSNTESLVRRELGLSLKQNIFSGFGTSSEVERTSYATSAEQWRLHSLAEDIALEVIKVYVDLIRTEEFVNLSERNLRSHIDIQEQIKERTDSGFSSKADLSQIDGRLANAQSNLIAAKNNYLDSKTKFYRVTEQAPVNLVIPVPDAKMLPKNEGEGLKTALSSHPAISASSNDILSATKQHESSKSIYYPEINFEIDANLNNNIDGVTGDNNDLTAMLRFKYNLFSGGLDSAFTRETAYGISEAKALNITAHREVKEGFILSWHAFELLNEQKKYIKLHVVASKNTQADYKEQFKIGQRSLLDLLDTENELFQSRQDFLDAEFAEITARYRILHSMGILLDTLRVTKPNTWKGEKPLKGGVSYPESLEGGKPSKEGVTQSSSIEGEKALEEDINQSEHLQSEKSLEGGVNHEKN